MMSGMRRFPRDIGGSALVEAALVLPFLLIVTLGLFQFGLLLNYEILVSNAAGAGGRQASISRGDPSSGTNIVNAVDMAGTGLNTAHLTVYVCVGTTGSNPACTSTNTCGSSCAADFSSSQGLQVTVAVQYSCSSLFVFGSNWSFLNGSLCPISTSVTEIVQ